MMQLLVAHMKLKMIHKLIQKLDPCMNTLKSQYIFSLLLFVAKNREIYMNRIQKFIILTLDLVLT